MNPNPKPCEGQLISRNPYFSLFCRRPAQIRFLALSEEWGTEKNMETTIQFQVEGLVGYFARHEGMGFGDSY